MGTELETAPEIQQIVDELDQGRFGSLHVLAVSPRLEEDSDGTLALFFDVTLPQPDEDTWDYEDVLKLRHRLRELVNESSLDLPYYVVLQPEQEDEQEEDRADSPSPRSD